MPLTERLQQRYIVEGDELAREAAETLSEVLAVMEMLLSPDPSVELKARTAARALLRRLK